MCYPTLEEVKHAGREQLRAWLHGLPTPGHYVVGSPDYAEVEASERFILQLILRKYRTINAKHPTHP